MMSRKSELWNLLAIREDKAAKSHLRQQRILQDRMAHLRDRQRYIERIIREYRGAPQGMASVPAGGVRGVANYLLQLNGIMQSLQTEEKALSAQMDRNWQSHLQHADARTRYETLQARAAQLAEQEAAQGEVREQDAMANLLFIHGRDS